MSIIGGKSTCTGIENIYGYDATEGQCRFHKGLVKGRLIGTGVPD